MNRIRTVGQLNKIDFDLISEDEFWNNSDEKELGIHKVHPTRFYKVPKLHNKDAICFDLRKVKIFRKPSDINKLSVGEKKNKMNFKRIGRLLPPYINALQRKYAHFVTRPGEWRDPDQD